MNNKTALETLETFNQLPAEGKELVREFAKKVMAEAKAETTEQKAMIRAELNAMWNN